MGNCIGNYYRGFQGDARSVGYSFYGYIVSSGASYHYMGMQ